MHVILQQTVFQSLEKGVHMLLQKTAFQSLEKWCTCVPAANCLPINVTQNHGLTINMCGIIRCKQFISHHCANLDHILLFRLLFEMAIVMQYLWWCSEHVASDS